MTPIPEMALPIPEMTLPEMTPIPEMALPIPEMTHIPGMTPHTGNDPAYRK